MSQSYICYKDKCTGEFKIKEYENDAENRTMIDNECKVLDATLVWFCEANGNYRPKSQWRWIDFTINILE